MAQVELNMPFVQISGSVSKNSPYYVRYDKRTGKQFLCRKPQPTPKSIAAKSSPKVMGNQDQFKAALEYARQVMADPNRKRIYEEQWKKKGQKHYLSLRGYICSCYYAEYLNHASDA